MNFIELTNESGSRLLLDFDSGWEIVDMGAAAAARWVNHTLGRNLYANDNYESLRARLALTNPMLTLGKTGATK